MMHYIGILRQPALTREIGDPKEHTERFHLNKKLIIGQNVEQELKDRFLKLIKLHNRNSLPQASPNKLPNK